MINKVYSRQGKQISIVGTGGNRKTKWTHMCAEWIWLKTSTNEKVYATAIKSDAVVIIAVLSTYSLDSGPRMRRA